jgi:hypothetical protein
MKGNDGGNREAERNAKPDNNKCRVEWHAFPLVDKVFADPREIGNVAIATTTRANITPCRELGYVLRFALNLKLVTAVLGGIAERGRHERSSFSEGIGKDGSSNDGIESHHGAERQEP